MQLLISSITTMVFSCLFQILRLQRLATFSPKNRVGDAKRDAMDAIKGILTLAHFNLIPVKFQI
jgi:hypothetical protein